MQTLPLTPVQFSRVASPKTYLTPPHVLYLQRAYLQVLTNPEYTGLIAELPVRHGKTLNLSKLWVAWYLDTFPDNDVLLLGHSQQFAEEMGAEARQAFRRASQWHIRSDYDRIDHWKIDKHAGSCRSFGVNAGVSGSGGHLIVMDDIYRGAESANSTTQRGAVWKWFMNDVFTRMEPRSKIINVLSRRHREDASGMLLNTEEMGGLKFLRVRLPALCDSEDDGLNRKIGDALWPARFSKDALLQKKKQYDLNGESFIFEGLFQQNPMADPSLRDWPDSYFTDIFTPAWPDKRLIWRVMAVDPSKGKSKKSDFCAIVDMRFYEDRVIYCDYLMRRMPVEAIEDTIVSRLGQSYSGNEPPYTGCIIEVNGDQELIAKNVHYKCAVRKIPTPIYGKENIKDKIMRIRESLGPLLQQKRLKILHNHGNNKIAYNQFLDFGPKASYDDAPDAAELGTQLINALLGDAPSDGQPLRLMVK